LTDFPGGPPSPTLPAAPAPAAPVTESTAALAARHADLKRLAVDAIVANRAQILDLSHRIHANPEPAFKELQAATWVADAVRQHGYAVEHPAGRLQTAVRGRLAGGGGGPGPRIGILAEYDALPGLGHGCGHNLMAAQGVGAAIGLAAISADLPGEIVFLGTPAEEFGSGKQWMIDDGLFEGLDAALLFHPGDDTYSQRLLLACEDVEVTFTGRQAHAAADPWEGLNALDAMVVLLNAIALWRQQLRPDARVHGVIVEGGTAANIIPDRTVGRFMIRSRQEADFGAMRERFARLVEAAALATGCSGVAAFSGGSSTMKNNVAIANRFAANMAAHGIVDGPPNQLPGSSDMGNVSQILPTIHPSLAICDAGVPGHSIAFREAARTDRADEMTITAAAIVAETAIDLLLEPDLVAQAWHEFREGTADSDGATNVPRLESVGR
jgi:amidohydrolase